MKKLYKDTLGFQSMKNKFVRFSSLRKKGIEVSIGTLSMSLCDINLIRF